MKLKTIEIAKFGMYGAIIYASKVVMSGLPNIHPVAVSIAALTLVYGKKALYPLYEYVILEGIFGGFSAYWIPYTYVWTILWAAFMLLPKKIPEKRKSVIYMTAVSLHGFLFGILCAPAEKILYGMSWKAMISWIISGLSFDAIHGISNFCLGILIMPLVKLFYKLESRKFSI